MEKSHNNGYKKKVQLLISSHEELATYHRRQDLHEALISILKDFRARCEELSHNGGLSGVMNEFGPKVMVLLDTFFGPPVKGRPSIKRAKVRLFLIEELAVIEGSYRACKCNVHQ